jgi:hypothetical protein
VDSGISEIAVLASSLLRDSADPEKAGPMAAYMKTDMPFYDVTSSHRKVISKHLSAAFPPETRADYTNRCPSTLAR